jgi:hypothetical protein
VTIWLERDGTGWVELDRDEHGLGCGAGGAAGEPAPPEGPLGVSEMADVMT